MEREMKGHGSGEKGPPGCPPEDPMVCTVEEPTQVSKMGCLSRSPTAVSTPRTEGRGAGWAACRVLHGGPRGAGQERTHLRQSEAQPGKDPRAQGAADPGRSGVCTPRQPPATRRQLLVEADTCVRPRLAGRGWLGTSVVWGPSQHPLCGGTCPELCPGNGVTSASAHDRHLGKELYHLF